MNRKRGLMMIFLAVAAAVSAMKTETAAQVTEIYKGMGDASAAVALDEKTFIVANDEDNKLRIFERGKPDALEIFKLSEVFSGKVSDAKKRELDLEGAAMLDGKIFWIGSYGTNKDAEPRPDRQSLFAVEVKRGANGKFTMSPVGDIYTTLIGDLEKDARFDPYNLKAAKAIAPKNIGGLSIEGLAAAPDGALLIGFRNPLRGGTVANGFLNGGKALVVKLVNPLEVMQGKAARFDAPIEVDLGGFGIRSMEYYVPRKSFLIVAGAYHENEETPTHKREVSRLYWLNENLKSPPELLKNADLSSFNIEAAFFYPQMPNVVELFSDDGKLPANEGTNKTFRGIRQKF